MANFSITTVPAYGLAQMMSASQMNSLISRTTVAANETSGRMSVKYHSVYVNVCGYPFVLSRLITRNEVVRLATLSMVMLAQFLLLRFKY